MIPRRRVSYVIQPPSDPVPPRLHLPPPGISRLGSISPLLVRRKPSTGPDLPPPSPSHPRHRLAVATLAVDSTTQLVNRINPEGILYTGGRDGLLLSWDLSIPMQKKRRRKLPDERWEIVTGWSDDVIEEEGEDMDEKPFSDGDVLGDVVPDTGRSRKRTVKRDSIIPYEQSWEPDMEAFGSGNPAKFRQCVQAHNEWINDILLCNYNQTVISASSDGTIKAWNPHTSPVLEPATIGIHSDYVRCLAHCREQNWVASGSFDRTIKLWDLSRTLDPALSDPLITLNPPDAGAPKFSVYALATDPFGHTIASGSPEKVIRLWDPRSGKRTGKLVGHTDNIRAILISEDSKYLLTGSADATIKLWSLTSQTCLHTFIHHTESVWSLASSHPSLEIFYSGDKTGLVCRVDVEDCSHVSEGECVVLCKDTSEGGADGINKIVVLDDRLMWTASGTSSVRRWRAPQRRVERPALYTQKDGTVCESPVATKPPMEPSSPPAQDGTPLGARASLAPSIASETWPPSVRGATTANENDGWLCGVPYQSLVRLTSANDPFMPYPASLSRMRDPDAATVYSAASFQSLSRVASAVTATTTTAATATAAGTSTVAAPRHPPHPVLQRAHADSPKRTESGRPWEDTLLTKATTARTHYEERELAADATPLCLAPEDVLAGDRGLVRAVMLNDRMHALTIDTAGEVAVWDIVRCVCVGWYAPGDVGVSGAREALEAVRERIEGEAVVVPWANVDTKTGLLAVHVTERCFDAEMYADETGFINERTSSEDMRLNIGRWVLRNLFLGFVREEQRSRRMRDRPSNDAIHQAALHHRQRQQSQQSHHYELHHRSSSESSRTTNSTLGRTLSSSVVCASDMVPALPSPPLAAPSTPFSQPAMILLPAALDAGAGKEQDNVSRPRKPSGSSSTGGTQSAHADDAQLIKRQSGADAHTAGGGGVGFMGRLKILGKNAGRRGGEIAASLPGPGVASSLDSVNHGEGQARGTSPLRTARQQLLNAPLTPPSSSEAPTLALPPQTCVTISEEGAPGWTPIYRGVVASAGMDMRALEEAMPLWLLEYLLLNRYPPVLPVKMSFVMLPWRTPDPGQQLPELLNTAQSKLTASRFLRVRKLTVHIQDKLEKMGMTPPLSRDGTARYKPEDLYEVLCHDVLLPLDMTLAAVRQYVWRQSGELTLYYRKRILAPVQAATHRGGHHQRWHAQR